MILRVSIVLLNQFRYYLRRFKNHNKIAVNNLNILNYLKNCMFFEVIKAQNFLKIFNKYNININNNNNHNILLHLHKSAFLHKNKQI
jgi:hypothetical protein